MWILIVENLLARYMILRCKSSKAFSDEERIAGSPWVQGLSGLPQRGRGTAMERAFLGAVENAGYG